MVKKSGFLAAMQTLNSFKDKKKKNQKPQIKLHVSNDSTSF